MNTDFEFDGEKYKKASAHQKEWGNRIISEFNFKGNEIILDLGCGDGALTKNLSLLVPDGFVKGIDASGGMIDTAKELESANLSFQRLNINDISFNNEFDIVFSNATLHWIFDHKKLLKNIYKALKDYGVIRLNFAGDGNCSNFFDVIKETLNSVEFKQYFKNFQWPWFMPTISEYKTLVKDCGFTKLEIWEENADRYFPSKEEMIKWIDQPSIVPFIKLLDEPEKKKFRDKVIDRMIEKTEHEDGCCFETFRRINVYAKK